MSVDRIAAAPGPARPQSTAGRRGPSRIVLVRHGESLGNVADRDARAKGAGQAGIMVGLLARGASLAQAAVWGAFLHGRSGELAAAGVGAVRYLAREVPAYVPVALSELDG